MSTKKRKASYKSLLKAKNPKTNEVSITPRRQASVRQTLERIIMDKSETKYVDNANVAGTVPIAGSVVGLSFVAQGTNTNQRVGNHVYHKYVHGKVVISAAATNAVYQWRFFVALDKQPNGALANYSDIYNTTTVDGGMALRANATYGDRFRILKVCEGVVAGYGGSPTAEAIDIYIPLDRDWETVVVLYKSE